MGENGGHLSWIDYSIVVASLFAVWGVGIWSSRKSRQMGSRSADSYFLAGRSMPWWIAAASLFASNIGTEHFVGQAGAAATGGIAVGLYEWSAAYLLLLLGWVFAPVYLRNQLTTVPEYLEGRYNRGCRIIFVIVTLLVYVLAKIGASVFAGAVLIEVVTGINFWLSVPAVIVATAVYTISGGLTAVMWTDTIQTMIFVVGGLLGTGISLHLVGGISGLFECLRNSDLGYMTHMVRSKSDPDYPWLGMLFGMPIVSIWYWCIDQEMVQRVLSVRTLTDAQLATATAGFFKTLPVFITVVPGMVARALYEKCKNGEGFESWCLPGSHPLSEASEANKAYPLFVIREFPIGVKGILVASFLAAMMSSLSSVYNSAATIVTYDLYERFWYPQGHAPPARLLAVGRLTTIILTLATFIWLPAMNANSHGLYLTAQQALTHLSPQIVALFLLGFFWKRANGPGALVGIACGSALGLVRWATALIFQSTCDHEDYKVTAASWFMCLNFNYFAIILFVFTIAIMVIVSLMTDPPKENQTTGYTYFSTQHSRVVTESPRVSQCPPVPYNPFASTSAPPVGEKQTFGIVNAAEMEAVGSGVRTGVQDGADAAGLQTPDDYRKLLAKVLSFALLIVISCCIFVLR